MLKFFEGPNSWKESYPICGENSQSPIAIDENTSKLNSSLANFDRTIFGELPNRLTLENTGHSRWSYLFDTIALV